jgi:hypothetical protein
MMTLAEFEAEADRLGYVMKEEGFVPHFEHKASGRRVDYVSLPGNCYFIDCERTLKALKADAKREPVGPRQAAATPREGEDWITRCGIGLHKATADTGWPLRRLQEETLSSVVGRHVIVSDKAAKGEAIEIAPPASGGKDNWLVLNPADAQLVMSAMKGSGPTRR